MTALQSSAVDFAQARGIHVVFWYLYHALLDKRALFGLGTVLDLRVLQFVFRSYLGTLILLVSPLALKL